MDPVKYYKDMLDSYTKPGRRIVRLLCPGLESLDADTAEDGDVERELAYLLKAGREKQLVAALDLVDAISQL